MTGAGVTEKVFVTTESLLRDSMDPAMRIVRGSFRPTFLVALWRGGAPIGESRPGRAARR